MSVIELHDLVIVVRGGAGALPSPGTVFSGAVGETLEDAAAFVPHGTIRFTTISQSRAEERSDSMNGFEHCRKEFAMDWAPIRYRDFYDLPRIFITSYNGKDYLFDCPFDDELDDYPDSYRVYQLPALPEEDLQGSWEHLTGLAVNYLGVIPVAEVQFDPTKRERINTAIFRELLAQQEPQTALVA